MITAWSDGKIETNAERYASQLRNIFHVLECGRISHRILEGLDLSSDEGNTDLRHLRRLHRALSEQVTSDMPSDHAPALDHVAYAQSVSFAKNIAPPNPLHPTEASTGTAIERSYELDHIDSFRKLGIVLLAQLQEHEGEHYLARYDERYVDIDAARGSCAIEPIESEHQELFRARWRPCPWGNSLADWLVGVGKDYTSLEIALASLHATVGEIHYLSPRLAKPCVIALSNFAIAKSGIATMERQHTNPLYELVIGDDAVEAHINGMRGNPAQIIGQFIRKSNPIVAMPFLEDVTNKLGYTDRAELYGVIARYFNMDVEPRRNISFSPDGRRWLQLLGLIGS